MKTWEIHANIEKFKNKKFKLIRSPRTIRDAGNKIVRIGSIVKVGWFGMGDSTFYDLSFEGTLIECNNAFAEWEEVKEPVDFMTAVASGKRIKHEKWADFYELNEVFDGMSLISDNSSRKTILGKWYVED